MVPVAVIQEAFTKSGLSQREVARRMGYVKTIADTAPVRRMLGQESVRYETAVRFAEALGVDPVDLGV